MTPMTLTDQQLHELPMDTLKRLLDDVRADAPMRSVRTGYLLGRLAYRIEAEILERELPRG